MCISLRGGGRTMWIRLFCKVLALVDAFFGHFFLNPSLSARVYKGILYLEKFRGTSKKNHPVFSPQNCIFTAEWYFHRRIVFPPQNCIPILELHSPCPVRVSGAVSAGAGPGQETAAGEVA